MNHFLVAAFFAYLFWEFHHFDGYTEEELEKMEIEEEYGFKDY